MKALSGLITLACVSYTYATFSPAGSVRDVHKADKGVPSLGVPQSVQQTWAMFAPYYPAASYVKPPKGCSIDQVSLPCICIIVFVRVSLTRAISFFRSTS